MYVIMNILRKFWVLISLFLGFSIASAIGLGDVGTCSGIIIGLLIYFGGLAVLRDFTNQTKQHREDTFHQETVGDRFANDISNQNSPSFLNNDEVLNWRDKFKEIKWFEGIGQNTYAALSRNGIYISHETIICIVYADSQGTHISKLLVDKEDLTSQYAAFIATDNRIILVDPTRQTVRFIYYTDIQRAKSSQLIRNRKTYTVTTLSGSTAKIRVVFSPRSENLSEKIIDKFFERISTGSINANNITTGESINSHS